VSRRSASVVALSRSVSVVAASTAHRSGVRHFQRARPGVRDDFVRGVRVGARFDADGVLFAAHLFAVEVVKGHPEFGVRLVEEVEADGVRAAATERGAPGQSGDGGRSRGSEEGATGRGRVSHGGTVTVRDRKVGHRTPSGDDGRSEQDGEDEDDEHRGGE
jgi:hypothetical protein